MDNLQLKNLNESFEFIINSDRFPMDKISLTTLDLSIIESEEFRWYSKICLAIENNETIDDEEKLTFLAMHRTFLMML